jgi:hypothetical protein
MTLYAIQSAGGTSEKSDVSDASDSGYARYMLRTPNIVATNGMLGDWLLCEVLQPIKYLSPLFDRLTRAQGIPGSLETHQAPYGIPGPQKLSPMSMPDSAYGRAPHDPMAIYGSSVDAGAFLHLLLCLFRRVPLV